MNKYIVSRAEAKELSDYKWHESHPQKGGKSLPTQF
jgi:hypothetical protein